MGSGAIVTRRTYLSVALAVCGAIVLMAGCATVLAGETRRLESARGWQSLTSLGAVLIGCGFALGVAFAVVTSAGLRGGGRRRTGRGPAVLEPGSLLASGEYRPAAGRPAGMAQPGGWPGDDAAGVAGGSDPFGPDDRGGAEDWASAEDWGGPGQGARVAASGDDTGDETRAEDWLSHLRGNGLGPVHQPGRAAPSAPSASPAAASYERPASSRTGGFGPADYADEGWRLDGSEWVESHGHHAAAPEIHHPAAGRRHDTGQQPAYDTGQWRALDLDRPPDGET